MESLDLKNKSLGIVSSYEGNCGNATYTKQLMSDLKGHFGKVECIELNQDLIHSEFNKSVQENVIAQSKLYDFINIQCELGLFHKRPEKAIKFIQKIIDARDGQNILITFHSLGICNKVIKMTPFHFKLYKLSLIFRKKERKTFDKYRSTQSIILKKIIEYKKNGKNISIIVHQKELSQKLSFIGIDSYFHPIVSINQEDLIKFNNEEIRDIFLKKYNLDKNKTYIGCYGFYGIYKGLDIAIKTLELLPDNFKLIISSNNHPANLIKKTIFLNQKPKDLNNAIETSDPKTFSFVAQDIYTKYLMNLIKSPSIFNKIEYINHISDEDEFKFLISAMDINLFPYYEVGQQGSGPLSYAAHLGKSGKIILSRTYLFDTYEKNFFPNCFTFFDQGNFVELSKKILSVTSKIEHIKKARLQYNPQSNIKTYLDAFVGNKDVANYSKDQQDVF